MFDLLWFELLGQKKLLQSNSKMRKFQMSELSLMKIIKCRSVKVLIQVCVHRLELKTIVYLYGIVAHHRGPSVADEGRRGPQGPFLFDAWRIQADRHQVEGRQDGQIHPRDQAPPD